MALTLDLINAQSLLSSLTDDQKNAIVTLSANDENTVIGAKFGEVYRQMDETIEKALGIKRDGAEKTYKFLERAANEFADKYKDYDKLKGQIDTLAAEKKSLEEKIAKGGDEGIKAQLENVRKELETTKATYAALKTDYDNEKSSHAKELLGIKVDAELVKAQEGFKFKNTYSEAVLSTLKAQAFAKLKNMNPSFEGEEGKQRLVFHGADGVVLNNPNNALNPFTAKELLTKEYKDMDILDEKQMGGAGGKGNPPKPNALNASTQTEANEIITKQLLSEGFVKTDPRFHEELSKRFDESGANDLPLK